MFFSPFGVAVVSLGEGRASIGAFRAFDRFVLVWVCRFPLPLGVGGGGGSGAAVCDGGTPWTFLLPFLQCHETCALFKPAYGIMVLIAFANSEGSVAPVQSQTHQSLHIYSIDLDEGLNHESDI